MNNQASEMVKRLCTAIQTLSACSRTVVRLEYRVNEDMVLTLPMTIVKGNPSDTVLWVQGGMHGDEYDGPEAACRFLEQLQENCFSGTVVVLPMVNPTAFEAQQNASPLDGVNLNRVFGTVKQASASYAYGEFLLELIRHTASFVIDLHGGGQYLDVCRFAMIAKTGTDADSVSSQAAHCCGAEYIYVNSSEQSGMMINGLSRLGIPGILLENGGSLSWQEQAVQHHLDAVFRIMAFLGMTDAVQTTTQQATEIAQVTELYFERGGLLRRSVSVGEMVVKGQLLLETQDIRTGEHHRIVCPVEQGVVLSIHTAALVTKNQYAVMIGRLE